MGQKPVQIGSEIRIVLCRQPRLFKIQQQGHQRLGDITSAERPEMSGCVRPGAEAVRVNSRAHEPVVSGAITAPRAARMKAAIRSRLLRPGASSTPEDASTKEGFAIAIARPTFSGFSPPATPQGRSS